MSEPNFYQAVREVEEKLDVLQQAVRHVIRKVEGMNASQRRAELQKLEEAIMRFQHAIDVGGR